MNFKMMGKLISQIQFVEAIFMVPALALCIYDKDMKAAGAFACSLLIIAVFSLVMFLICRKAQKKFYAREGLVCVALSWIMMSLFGCLPFVISGAIPGFIDALFETVSGFTTTGASILSDVESMSRGLLFWRSFTHWIGGMGVLVFLLAVVSVGGNNSGYTLHLLRAESPGPNVGKLVPKMSVTAKILYLLYFLLTVLDFIFLKAGGMSIFEAVCTAMGTAGTGGFGVKNDSIAGYSPYIQNVTTVFMLLFGVNFSCYYMLAIRRFREVFKDEELRMYFLIVISAIIVITINIRPLYDSLGNAIRDASFQVASITTTTGFATADFDTWPSLSKGIIVFLMAMGACAGSTGGGFKVGRALLVIKNLKRNIHQTLNPRKVMVVRNNGQMIDEKVINNTSAYLAAYVVIVVISFLLVSIDGKSVTTNLTSVLSCVNNIGPGLEGVGPTCNFGSFSVFSKIVFIIDMLAGRLELFPLIILLSKNTWSNR